MTILQRAGKNLYTFKKSDRILKRHEFLKISRFGQRIQNRQFIALYIKKSGGNTRLGITVTKKVGKAARRNRIKRFVREYFRKNRQKLPPGVKMNIIAKKEAVILDAGEIFSSLDNIFEKITKNASRTARQVHTGNH